MSQQIVQINFQFNVAVDEYRAIAINAASHFAHLPGLVWKVWLLDEERKTAGGIYLFESETAVNEYKSSPLFRKLEANPAITHISFRQSSLLNQPGRLTRAPVEAIVP